MNKPTVCLVLMCLVVAVFNVYSVEGRSVSGDKIITTEKCYYNKKDYGVGEKWSVLGECNIYTCQKGGAISALTCPLMAVPENSPCAFTEVDLKKMYPKCCPQLVCPPE